MPDTLSDPACLFVYGTLRAAFDGAMARWLRANARLLGPATIGGYLYRVADYPGLVPGSEGLVLGDLFALNDAASTLARLDAYEEMTADHPPPHEYRRVRWRVQVADEAVEAWVYIYAHDVAGLERIVGGDFLACARPTGS
ncbi:hypothetical protein ASE85_12750 [Sphingobium sp. Leaf26]|uniref:gamma-glutamylcyclotransferase family protein n=1 Tax=Sphingobium sp. Leaf26 TaxID=1735693 RepID=UPI0006F91D56|nr:gamma-glutamylcyclotransferase family protein [Sphingobium sp. Leaf26]KQM98702.1 hypothetical protein ASE85_12750 [Sphingobium sp. Leaf26]